MSAAKPVYAVTLTTAAALASFALFLSSPASAVTTVPGFRASMRITQPARVTDAVAFQVQAGMTRGDIVALIGEPHRTMRFPLSRTTAWDYAFVDSWGYASELSVVFNDNGVVVGKVSSRNDY